MIHSNQILANARNSEKAPMRYSSSPELLQIGGATYTPSSANATTFLILEEVVVHSREFHVVIINALRAMSSAKDLRATKDYGIIKFSSPLPQAALDAFKASWVGTLGTVRANNKAGRVWKKVTDNHGQIVSVISFWAEEKSITSADVDLLRKTFGLTTQVIVDYQGRKDSVILPARSGDSFSP